MAMLLGGVFMIAAMLVVSMAIPFIHYMKRDNAWLNSDRSVASWYRLQ